MNFYHTEVHRNWKSLWKKIYRIETVDNHRITLNRMGRRVHFHSLKRFCLEFTPLHLYMSVLNYFFPEHSVKKSEDYRAHPVNGEYVLDVDSLLYPGTCRHTSNAGVVCLGCLAQTKNQAHRLLDGVEDHYDDVHIVFNGNSGFNIHVLDFNVRDWTHYSIDNPQNSYEVARMKFSKQLQNVVPHVFHSQNFKFAVDTLGGISFPESLDGETGLKCSYLGSPDEFRDLEVEDIIQKAANVKHTTTTFNRLSTTNWKNTPYNPLITHS